MAVNQTMTIQQISLPPGESIIVDAEQNYIFFQGQNITDSVAGGWIDDLSRNTERITVSADRSSISAEITYTERYL